MAARRRTSTTYSTYGSVAYAPVYDGNTVRVPRREEQQGYPQPAPRPRQREKTLIRARVQVREAGQIAPFAVVGFLAVAAFAVMVVMSYAHLTMAHRELENLRAELTALQTDNAALVTKYEKIFDLDSFQSAEGDAMVRPSSDQVVYIDLSEPDTVVVFETSGIEGGLRSLRQGLERVVDGIVEYFR